MRELTLQEFAKKYGIDISEFSLVDNIVDKSFRKIVETDELDGFRWYLFTNLRIRESYALGRKWRITDCIRDLLQNALDESGEKAKIYHDEEGLHIVDYGKGMPVEAFAFGGFKAEDPCYRGGFGEGLKIAVSTLVMLYGYTVYFVINDGLAYKLVARKDKKIGEQVLYLVVGMTNRKVKPHGTHVIIPRIPKNVIEDLKLVDRSMEEFVIHRPPVVEYDWVKGEYEYVDRYKCKVKYSILKVPNVIYASDLFFTIPSENDVINKPSMYGYNLWLTTEYELEPNRQAFKSGGLANTMAKIGMLLAEAPQRYWDALVKSSVTGLEVGKAKVVTLEGRYLELSSVPIPDCPGALDKLVNAIKKLGKDVSVLINNGTYSLDKILHYAPPGSTVVIINPAEFDWNVKKLHEKLPDFIDIIKEHIEKAEKEMNKDSLNGTFAHGFVKAMLDTIIRAVRGDPSSVILNLTRKPTEDIKGVSTWNHEINKGVITIPFYDEKYGELVIDKSEILRLLIHELGHILPYVSSEFRYRYGLPRTTLDHTEEAYEYALQFIAKSLFEMGSDERLRNVLDLGLVMVDESFRAPDKIKLEVSDRIKEAINRLKYQKKGMIETVLKKAVAVVPRTYFTSRTPQLFVLTVSQSSIEESWYRVVPEFDVTFRTIRLPDGEEVSSFGDKRMLEYYTTISINDKNKIMKLIEPVIKDAEAEFKSRVSRGVAALIFIDPTTGKATILTMVVRVHYRENPDNPLSGVEESLFIPYRGEIEYEKRKARW